MDNGTTLELLEKIHDGIIQYFQKFLGHHQINEVPDISHLISTKISEEENAAIVHQPTKIDLKNALTSIPTNSSLGPDGFSLGFLIAC